MNRDDLLDKLSRDILAYVMHGEFPERHFLGEIKPEELDDRFVDYEMLIRLHFILRPDVISFVESLPSELRSVKTQTENVSTVNRGAIQGRINWSKTTQERQRRNPNDRSIFVCDNRSENYDVDENIVLKKLLSVIYHTLVDTEEYLREDYEWVTDRWRENLELVDRMKEIFERNVHVTRIRQPKTYEPTGRMLIAASESRQTVYRESATLLETYRSSLAGDEAAIKELLETTAVAPDDDETLFELFVLFRYIDAIESMQGEQFELQTIASGKQEIARLSDTEGGADIVLYHDSSTTDRNISFDDAPRGNEEDFNRYEVIRQESIETARQYFKNDRLDSITNRPDVIVLEITDGDASEYLITEVKYSKQQETIRQGIEETLEYLAFLRQDDEFVFDAESKYLGNGWNGILAIQDLPHETASLEAQSGQPIRILQATEVETKLDEVLSHVLEFDQ